METLRCTIVFACVLGRILMAATSLPPSFRTNQTNYSDLSSHPSVLITRLNKRHIEFYQNLCVTKQIQINFRAVQTEFDFRPPHLEGYVCESLYANYQRDILRGQKTWERESHSTGQHCGERGFQCIQRLGTVYIGQRNRTGSDCWKTVSRKIPLGCDCMSKYTG